MTYKQLNHKLLSRIIRKLSFICSISGIYDESYKKDFNEMVQMLEILKKSK